MLECRPTLGRPTRMAIPETHQNRGVQNLQAVHGINLRRDLLSGAHLTSGSGRHSTVRRVLVVAEISRDERNLGRPHWTARGANERLELIQQEVRSQTGEGCCAQKILTMLVGRLTVGRRSCRNKKPGKRKSDETSRGSVKLKTGWRGSNRRNRKDNGSIERVTSPSVSQKKSVGLPLLPRVVSSRRVAILPP